MKTNNMKTIREEFDEYVKPLGTAQDLLDAWEVVRRSEDDMIACLKFLKEHNFDCTHLWEDDTEEGDRSYKDYDEIWDWVIANIPGEPLD